MQPPSPPETTEPSAARSAPSTSARLSPALGGMIAAEILLIFCLFYIYAGLPPPDANESHYLVKAKHFWDPSWCARDLFLQSQDAHWVFYVTVGALTPYLSLTATAWIGRIAAWLLLAAGWCYLSRGLTTRPLIAVLTAAWFLVFHHMGTMAGEWVIGGVEGKSFAYGLILFGLGDLVRGRWKRVWIWLGAASAFHVVVGGWSVLAAGFAWLCCGRKEVPWWRLVPALSVGLLLAAPSIYMGLRLTAGTDPELARHANQILVFQRLAHHLYFDRFPREHVLRFVALAVAWILLSRAEAVRNLPAQRLRDFVLGSLLFTLAGVLLSLLAPVARDFTASLLKYYWFRLADFAVPMGAAITLVVACLAWGRQHERWGRVVFVCLLLAPAPLLLPSLHEGIRAPRPRAVTLWDDPARALEARQRRYREWLDVCEWVRKNTPEEALLLTPRSQQSFKWYAQRAEVFNWKDVPQDVPHLIQWQERRRRLYPRRVFQDGYTAFTDDELLEVAELYGAQYLVVRRWRMTRLLGPRLRQVYPTLSEENASFAVFRFDLMEPHSPPDFSSEEIPSDEPNSP
jgi:hypothetical protein